MVMNAHSKYNLKIGGRTVGVIRGDLLDVRRHSNGFLQVPPAIALSVATVESARQAGVTRIAVKNMDSGTLYTISLSDFISHSWCDQRGKFEPQYLVALDRFEVTRQELGDASAAFKSYDARHNSGPVQIGMFG